MLPAIATSCSTRAVEPDVLTVKALPAGTELVSSGSSYVSTTLLSVIAAALRVGAVVSPGAGVSLVTARLLRFAAALPAGSRIGLVEGAS